jgi:hypothetical protein
MIYPVSVDRKVRGLGIDRGEFVGLFAVAFRSSPRTRHIGD